MALLKSQNKYKMLTVTLALCGLVPIKLKWVTFLIVVKSMETVKSMKEGRPCFIGEKDSDDAVALVVELMFLQKWTQVIYIVQVYQYLRVGMVGEDTSQC